MYNYRDAYEQYQLDKLKKLPQMIKFAEDIISGNETYGMESNLFFGIWQDVLYLLQNKEATRHDFSKPELYRVPCADCYYDVEGEKVLGKILQQVFNIRLYIGIIETRGICFDTDDNNSIYYDNTRKKVYSIFPIERSDIRFDARELVECLDDLEILENDKVMHFYEFGSRHLYPDLEGFDLEGLNELNPRAEAYNMDLGKLRSKYLACIGSEGTYPRRSQEEIHEIESKVEKFNLKALLLGNYKLKIIVGLIETTLDDVITNGLGNLYVPNFINVISFNIDYDKGNLIQNKVLNIPDSVSVILAGFDCLYVDLKLHDKIKYIDGQTLEYCRNREISFNPENKDDLFIAPQLYDAEFDKLSFNKNVTGMVRADSVHKKLYIEEGSNIKVFCWDLDAALSIPELDIPEEQFIGLILGDYQRDTPKKVTYNDLYRYIGVWEEKTGRKFNKKKKCYKDALVTITKRAMKEKIEDEWSGIEQLDDESIMILEELLDQID